MSSKFEKVKSYYDRELWDISRVRNAVVKGWITAEEFFIITGEIYTAQSLSQLKQLSHRQK